MYQLRYFGRESVARVRLSGQGFIVPTGDENFGARRLREVQFTRDNSMVGVDVVQNFNLY